MKTLFMILMFALVAGGASECEDGDECQHTCYVGYPGGCPDDIWKCEVGKCDKINGQYATCCGPYGYRMACARAVTAPASATIDAMIAASILPDSLPLPFGVIDRFAACSAI